VRDKLGLAKNFPIKKSNRFKNGEKVFFVSSATADFTVLSFSSSLPTIRIHGSDEFKFYFMTDIFFEDCQKGD